MVNESGCTSVFFGIFGRQVHVVEYLVKWAPGINSKAMCDGSTPLHFACHLGYEEFVKILLEPQQLADKNQNIKKNIKTLEMLFAVDNNEETPVDIASRL